MCVLQKTKRNEGCLQFESNSEQCSQNMSNLKKSNLPLPVSHSRSERKRQHEDELWLSSNIFGHRNIPDPAKRNKLYYDELEDTTKPCKLSPQWEGSLNYQSKHKVDQMLTPYSKVIHQAYSIHK